MRERRNFFSSALCVLVLLALPLLAEGKTKTPILLNRPLCGVAPGRTNAAAKSTLRVATFNVLHGLEETATYPTHSTLDDRLALAVKAIDDADIDLVGMQEVSDTRGAQGHTSGNVAIRMATRLAQVTSVTWHWCWTLSNPHVPPEPDIKVGGGGPLSDEIAARASDKYDSFKEGSAVLSRYPIERAESRRLPTRFPLEYVACPPKDVPVCNVTAVLDHRIALFARVTTPGGATDIIATHLAHDLTAFSDMSTFEQAVALVDLAQESTLKFGEAARRFITCDCNVTTDDLPPVVAFLEAAGWTDTYATLNPNSLCAPPHDRSACTSDQDILAPASTAAERIDYVFAQAGTCELNLTRSRKYADRPGRSRTHRYLWPSDHHAVWTDVAVGGCDG